MTPPAVLEMLYEAEMENRRLDRARAMRERSLERELKEARLGPRAERVREVQVATASEPATLRSFYSLRCRLARLLRRRVPYGTRAR